MPPRPSNAALDGAEAAFLTAMEDLDLVFGMPKVSSMVRHQSLDTAINRAVRSRTLSFFPSADLFP